jgi:hypothetical protein
VESVGFTEASARQCGFCCCHCCCHFCCRQRSFDATLLQRQVSAARAAGPDLVVVLVHWGPNWHLQPDKHLRELGHAFLTAGADIVFGTSPHHLQVRSGRRRLMRHHCSVEMGANLCFPAVCAAAG